MLEPRGEGNLSLPARQHLEVLREIENDAAEAASAKSLQVQQKRPRLEYEA